MSRFKWILVWGTLQRLGHLAPQRLGPQIPIDQEQCRVRGVKRHKPFAIFNDHTFGIQKTQGVILAGAITHKERQARFLVQNAASCSPLICRTSEVG